MQSNFNNQNHFGGGGDTSSAGDGTHGGMDRRFVSATQYDAQRVRLPAYAPQQSNAPHYANNYLSQSDGESMSVINNNNTTTPNH